MKKIVIGLAACLCSMSALAIDNYGLYVGGDVTATYWDFDVNNKYRLQVENILEQTRTYSDAASADSAGWDYSIEGRFGGYKLWGETNQRYTALEIFGAPHDYDPNVTRTLYNDNAFLSPALVTSPFTLEQKSEAEYSFGIDFKQGYLFKEDWLAYFKVGAVLTHYKIRTQINAPEVVEQEGDALSLINSRDSETLAGIRFGLGVEKFWDDNLSTTLSVIYTVYESWEYTTHSDTFEFFDPGQDEETLAELRQKTKLEPWSAQVGLGVNFYFY